MNKKIIPAIKLFGGDVYIKINGPMSATLEFYSNVKEDDGSMIIRCLSYTFDFEPAGGPPALEVATIEDYYFDEETKETIKKVFLGGASGIVVSSAVVFSLAVIAGVIPVGAAATAAGVVVVIGLAAKEIKEKIFNQ